MWSWHGCFSLRAADQLFDLKLWLEKHVSSSRPVTNRYEGMKVVTLPPLRERREDIPLLVNALMENLVHKGLEHKDVSEDGYQAMMEHSWPGNVRELQNTVERAAVLSQGQEIVVNHLPESITQLFQNAFIENENEKALSIDDKLKEIEKGMIIDALKKTNGIQIRAAELMGINQRSLWHRIKKYQIDAAAFKSNKG